MYGESWIWLRCTHRVVMVWFFSQISLPFSFVLLSRDLYRAISRHWITLVSPHFSTSVSLIQVRLFTISQPRTVWHKASSSSGICLVALLLVVLVITRLKSSLVYTIFLMPMQSLRSHILRTHCACTCLLSRMLPMKLLLRKHLCPVYFRKQVHILLWHLCN